LDLGLGTLTGGGVLGQTALHSFSHPPFIRRWLVRGFLLIAGWAVSV
jgi:hypothetical protein